MCQTYTVAPSVAWHELGREPLGPRRRMLLTRSVTELAFFEQALADVARERTAKDAPPSIEVVKAARDIALLYAEDQGFDVYEDPATLEDATDAAQEPAEWTL